MTRSQSQRDQYNANRRLKKERDREVRERTKDTPVSPADLEIQQDELRKLEKRTRGQPTDADGDIDFAYRNMALPTVTPLMAPSMAGWSWYIYSRQEPNKFLEICAKREDAKSKMAGTITNQRMEDDKRQQFAVIERLKKELTTDVAAIIKELMEKFPDDVLRECRKFDVEWKAFLAKEPG